MNIPLKKHHAEWVAEQVRNGRYASEIEAIEDALATKIERDKEEVEYFRQRLQQAEEDVREGRTTVADDAFFDSLRARIQKVAEKSGG